VRQLHHPAADLLCHPNRERPRARVLGLDDWAEPLSGDGGRGATPRKKKGSGYGSMPKEVTGGRACGGARGGGEDPTMVDQARPARSSEGEDKGRRLRRCVLVCC
jgi:hypothetical protein